MIPKQWEKEQKVFKLLYLYFWNYLLWQKSFNGILGNLYLFGGKRFDTICFNE